VAGALLLGLALGPRYAWGQAAPGSGHGARLERVERDTELLFEEQDKLHEALSSDRLLWSGEYRTVVNNIHHQDRSSRPDGTSEDADLWFANMWSHRLRLWMRYDINARLRFVGRAVVYKNFGESDEAPFIQDAAASRYPRDTTLRLERMYFDWFVTDWLVLTLGRVASPEGPPAELKENTRRSATWGVQMVEGEYESILLTARLGRWLEDAYLRVFYSPFFSDSESVAYMDDGIRQLNIWGMLYEMKIPGLGDNLWQVGAVHIPSFRPMRLPLGGTLPSEPLPAQLGSYTNVNSLVQYLNIANSGLDVFGALSVVWLHPNEERLVYELGAADGEGEAPPLEVGLATYDAEVHTALMLYGGLRYRLPLGLMAPSLGLEYNQGSQHNVTWGTPSDTLVNKLATRGRAIEAYYLQPLVARHMFVRVGYVHIDRDHEGGFVGPSVAVDKTVSNLYALIDLSW